MVNYYSFVAALWKLEPTQIYADGIARDRAINTAILSSAEVSRLMPL